jgi:hypothetical protein
MEEDTGEELEATKKVAWDLVAAWDPVVAWDPVAVWDLVAVWVQLV